jgi:hypothetical protein
MPSVEDITKSCPGAKEKDSAFSAVCGKYSLPQYVSSGEAQRLLEDPPRLFLRLPWYHINPDAKTLT